MLAFLPPSVAATGYVRPSPFDMTPHGRSSSCYAPHLASSMSYDDYQHQLRLEELRRAEAAIQAAIAEEETRRRRRELEQRAAFELALRQQQAAEELQRRRRRQQQQHQQQEAEARLLAAAMARRAELAAQQERARQITVAAALQQAREEEEQYRRRLESARQHQQQQYRLRQQLEARRQRARAEVEVAPALVQLVLDIFASQQQQEEDDEQPAQQEVSKSPVTAPESNVPAAPEPSSSSSPDKAAEPALDPAPTAEKTLQEEEAAKVLQRRFRRHAARRSALDHLSTLATDLVSHRRAFEAPTELHFQSSPVISDATVVPSSQQPLAYDKSNKAFLAYEDFLVSLLSKIDAVESNGDKVVQRARKELVQQVEKELGQLDELKHQEWERQSGASSPAASDVEEAEEGKANKETEQEVADGESPSHTRPVSTSMILTLASPCHAASSKSASTSDVEAAPIAEEEPSDDNNHKDDVADASAADAETRADVEAPVQTESDPSAQPTELSTSAATATAPASSPAQVAEDAPAQVVASPSAPLAKSADPANLNTSRSLPADGATADDEDEGSSSDELESAAIEEVLKRAKALGERVEALERADAEAPEQEQEQEKQTADDTTSAPAHSTANSAPAPSAASETKSAEGDAKSDAGTEDFEML